MKFAVRIIKNQFHPLKVSPDANLSHGQYVIVKTDKGEEVFRVFIVNEQIQHLWEKHKPEALSVVSGCDRSVFASPDYATTIHQMTSQILSNI